MLLAQAPLDVPPPLHQIASQVQVGDVIFIRVPFRPFREVANTTMSWTNHVGIVVSTDGDEPGVAESTIPLSRVSPLSRFVGRSEQGRLAVMRWREPLSPQQQKQIQAAAHKRLGVVYDTGFNLASSRQFCSKYVREVVMEATGRELGEVVSFRTLLQQNPEVHLGFWKVWYFGRIPWERQTVSPASMLRSPALWTVFDGHVGAGAKAVEERAATP